MSELRTILRFLGTPERGWLAPLMLFLSVCRWARWRRSRGHAVAPFVYTTH